MPSDKPRVMLTLDAETHDFLKEIADLTGVPVAGIISRLLGAHLYELEEYLAWLSKQKDPRKLMFGKNLLQSYGPDDLIEGIRRLDPKHKFADERFEEAMRKK
jgi:hypothetical protein